MDAMCLMYSPIDGGAIRVMDGKCHSPMYSPSDGGVI